MFYVLINKMYLMREAAAAQAVWPQQARLHEGSRRHGPSQQPRHLNTCLTQTAPTTVATQLAAPKSIHVSQMLLFVT
jgi:hypothetical protein